MPKLVRYQPPAMPGWNTLTAPAQPKQAAGSSALWGTVAREGAIFAVLLGVAAVLGVLDAPWVLAALVAVRALLHILNDARGERRLTRTVIEWTAVAVVAAIIASAGPTLPARKTAPPKAPTVKVDAAQVDQLEQARTGAANVWADVYERIIAQGGADPANKEAP
jgi:hypothetical protein